MQLMHHTEFDIYEMASRIVGDKFYKPVGAAPNSVDMSGGFVTYQNSRLMEKHFTNTCI